VAGRWIDAGVFLARLTDHDPAPSSFDLGPITTPVRPRARNKFTGPKLDREQAHAAAELADRVGTDEAAVRFGVCDSTLRLAWKRYGIQPPHRSR
jgi:hypothetical protein